MNLQEDDNGSSKDGGEDFRWGTKAAVGKWNKDIQSYNSFTYRGIEYGLYDCVHVYHDDSTESYIGKIVKMWTADDTKKVKLVWFFRPLEIRGCLGGYKPQWNELFLASGLGQGVCNSISPEAIIRKCNVVCTSEDERNSQATDEELEMADFFFSCTFDVAKTQILKNLPDHICGIKVENFLNKRREHKSVSSGIIKPKMRALFHGLGESSKVNNHSLTDGQSAGISLIPGGNLGAQRRVLSESIPVRPESSVPHDGDGHGKTPLIQAIDKVNVNLPITSSNLRAEQFNLVPRDGDGSGKTPLIQVSGKVNVSLPIGTPILRAEQTNPTHRDGDGLSNAPHNQAINRVKVSFRFGSSILQDNLKNSVHRDGAGHTNTPHNKAINKVKVGLPKGSSTGQGEPRNSVPRDGGGGSNTEHNQVKVSLPMGSTVVQVKSEDLLSKKKKKFEMYDYGRHNSGQASPQTEEEPDKLKKQERITWFKELSPEECLQAADRACRLVLIENLDPSFTSSEIKDLVWRAFNERVEAKMLQRTSFSNPCPGEAFVIFKSRDAANAAIMKLQNKCLVLSNGRVLFARAAKLPKYGKAKTLNGHLKKRNRKVSEEWRQSVSTAHCAQPNTIEYELALEWDVRHEQWERCWQKLRQVQQEEKDELRKRLNAKLDK